MEYKYGFLFKKSSLPKVSLAALLSMDDFVSEAESVLAMGKGIEDRDIYEIVKKLLFPKIERGERTRESGILFKAVKKFSKVLYGDSRYWVKEYEEFLK